MTIDEVLFDDIAGTIGDRAFPVTIAREGKTVTGTGLTKRELFAAMAMQGLGAHPAGSAGQWPDLARDAVAAADALLAALDAPSGVLRTEEK